MHFSRRFGAPRRGHATGVRSASAIALTIATSVTGLALASAPASAAAPLACTDTLYVADSSTGDIRPLNPATGAVGPAAYDGTPAGGTGNQLGRGPGWCVRDQHRRHQHHRVHRRQRRHDGDRRSPRSSAAGTVAGAIDPDERRSYYYGGYAGRRHLAVLGLRPGDEHDSTGPVANVTVPAAPGTNGDLAFDADGILYFVAASATEYRALHACAPSSRRRRRTPSPSFTATELTRTTGLPAASNGIAFASDGYLYLGRLNEVTKVNPIDGCHRRGRHATGRRRDVHRPRLLRRPEHADPCPSTCRLAA